MTTRPNPSKLKHLFSDDEMKVWESIFPPAKLDPTGQVRRRRPSELYLSKIIRSLAELGVYPVFRSTPSGELVPWDVAVDPQPGWVLDPYIRKLLGNVADLGGSDPGLFVDAYYHPNDLAKRFGASASMWYQWAEGAASVRPGPTVQDVAPVFKIEGANLEYIKARGTLDRYPPTIRFASTGAVAFFAAASTKPWNDAASRSRISPIKKLLSVDFHVLYRRDLLPADPVLSDLDNIEIVAKSPVILSDKPEASPDTMVVTRPRLSVLDTKKHPMDTDEEIRVLEARLAQLHQKKDLEVGRSRYNATIERITSDFKDATVLGVEFDVPDFDPANPLRDVAEDCRPCRIFILLSSGQEYVFDSGIPVDSEIADLNS